MSTQKVLGRWHEEGMDLVRRGEEEEARKGGGESKQEDAEAEQWHDGPGKSNVDGKLPTRQQPQLR